MRAHRVLGCLLFGGCVWAQQYVISTIAGGAPPPTPAVAKSASIGDPTRLATDAAGNVYFGSLHSVFKVDAGGTLTRVAGNGRPGNSGDGGPAAAAQLSFPMGLAADTAGNLFVADRDASVVRRIAANGIITTVAGSGVPGFAGDGGAATSAQINGPYGVAVGAGGSLYIADTGNNVVRKVSPDGAIRTVAGTGTRGYLGDGGAALSAWLNAPEAVAVDAEENLYIADTFNGRIRRVGTDGVIATVAGVGSTGIYSGDGGPARDAAISLPTDVALDGAGTLYLADFGNTRVRMVSGGIITTVAGQTNGAPLTEGQAAVNVRLEGPTGVTVDSGGRNYFVEAGPAAGAFTSWRPASGRVPAWRRAITKSGRSPRRASSARWRGTASRTTRAREWLRRWPSSTGRPEWRAQGSASFTFRIRRISGCAPHRRRAATRWSHWRATVRRASTARSSCRETRSSTVRSGWRRMTPATGMWPTRRTTGCGKCSRAATCSPSRATEMPATTATAGRGPKPA